MQNKTQDDRPQSHAAQEFGTCLPGNMILTVGSDRAENQKGKTNYCCHDTY